MLKAKSDKLVLSNNKKDKIFSDVQVIESDIASSLFFVAAIEMKQETAQKIFEIISTVLEKENQKIITSIRAGEKTDQAERFEQLLNKVNNALATLASEGYTDWINKIHLVISAIWQDNLFLSCAGKAKAYLLRTGNLADIASKVSVKDATPMKTFTSTISGQLTKDDQLFLATPQLLENVSENEIKVRLEEQQPTEFINGLKQSLAESPNSASAVLVNIFNQAEESDDLKINFADSVPPTKSITAEGEDEEGLSFPDLNSSDNDPTAEVSPHPTVEKKENIYLKKLGSAIGQVSQAGKKSAGFIRSLSSKSPSRSTTKSRLTTNRQRDAKLPLGRSLGSNISGLAKETSRGLLKKFYDLPRSSQILAIAFLAMLVLFLGSIIVISQKKKQINELGQNEILLDKALNKEKEAADALIYHDKEKAKDLLLEAKAEANKLIAAGVLKEEADNLIAKIDDQLDKAEGITRIDDAILLAELEKKSVNELVGLNDKIYVYDEKTNLIYLLDEASKELQTVSQESNNLGYFRLAASNDEDGSIYLLTDTPALAEFDAAKKTLTKLDIEIFNKENKAKDLAQYGGKLYRLVPETKQIYKHTGTIAGYSKGTEWVMTDSDELENARSMTIDGYIYVLLADGTVNKYLRGKKQNFALADITTPMENPTKIFTADDLENLYIIDTKKERILAFNKNSGSLTAQFKSDEFKNLQDLFIDKEEKKMYVLADGKIYGIVLDIKAE
ncbi:MAG: hypothetical protein ABII72_04495 [Parcubacteria group bacterium]